MPGDDKHEEVQPPTDGSPASGEAAGEAEAAPAEVVEGESPEIEVVDGAEVEGEAVEAEIIEPPSPEAMALAAAESALEAERKRRQDTEARLRAVSKAYTDLQGEMEEFKKRMEARARLQVQTKAAEVVRAFFEPVQNLRRAAEAGGDAETLQTGLELVARQFTETMTRLGLQELPGVGAPFDPELHEALALAPVEDPAQDGMVLMVHRSGYALGQTVIQPAQVVIGKHEAPAAEA